MKQYKNTGPHYPVSQQQLRQGSCESHIKILHMLKYRFTQMGQKSVQTQTVSVMYKVLHAGTQAVWL